MIDSTITLAIASAVGGFIAGYFWRGIIDGRANKDYASVILVTVCIIWAFSVLVDIASVNYETPIAIHGLMGAIVGYYYKERNEKN